MFIYSLRVCSSGSMISAALNLRSRRVRMSVVVGAMIRWTGPVDYITLRIRYHKSACDRDRDPSTTWCTIFEPVAAV